MPDRVTDERATTNAERFDAAVAAWIARCEKHEIPFEEIDDAQLAYDEGSDAIPTGPMVALRILLTELFQHSDPIGDDVGDWEVGPLLLSRAAMTGYILGRKSATSEAAA